MRCHLSLNNEYVVINFLICVNMQDFTTILPEMRSHRLLWPFWKFLSWVGESESAWKKVIGPLWDWRKRVIPIILFIKITSFWCLMRNVPVSNLVSDILKTSQQSVSKSCGYGLDRNMEISFSRLGISRPLMPLTRSILRYSGTVVHFTRPSNGISHISVTNCNCSTLHKNLASNADTCMWMGPRIPLSLFCGRESLSCTYVHLVKYGVIVSTLFSPIIQFPPALAITYNMPVIYSLLSLV